MAHPVVSKLQDASLFIQKCCVNGEWVNAASGKSFEVQNPADGELIGNCPEFSKNDVDLAICAASDAFVTFSAMTGRERARLLRKWHDLVISHQDDLSYILSLENGKPPHEARGEVAYAASFLEWFSEEAPRTYGDTIPATNPGNQVLTVREPVGVCGLITPKAGAALAAGCTVVIKSPPETPFTANAIVELALRAGIPKGVINVVTAMDNTKEVGHALTSSALVKKVSFTGSTAVGKILMSQCAETTLKKISLELGGNAPFIVFSDADIDAAVEGAIISKYRSLGQTCVCANRFYIQDAIYEKFAAKLAARVRDEFVVGDGLKLSRVTHGPLIHARAVQKAEEHVRDAVSKGAKVLIGGSKMPELGNNFFQPTVLTGMTAEMKIASEETFGPVAGLFRFRTEKEVIQLANHTEMGLAAYLFTKDVQRAWRVAMAIEAGMVGLNTGLISDTAAPFGGIKSSGFGREGSKYGIDEYMTTKTVTLGGVTTTPRSRL
ncbi:succinate-semialdehyde dehydrogenase [Coniochaeta ligniaria NRRL 30616]|uniref:succinate-semialdehyde dehydrogenase [NAD(P)(+)] n=1 Tax=Coniochaeta ligniaria NRRL 30616 TaxID=1408157 RepID=A0A1J7IDC8_9PEZI|nr:succinate-semialdehyde dehydrogenase [Coniochaeta ligniaria NRRL 30616]